MGLGNLILIVIGVCVFLFSCYKWYRAIVNGDSLELLYFLVVYLGLATVLFIIVVYLGDVVIPWLNQIEV